MDIDGRVAMSTAAEMLRDIGLGHGPRKSLIAFGYAGWAPVQLEEELATASGWSCRRTRRWCSTTTGRRSGATRSPGTRPRGNAFRSPGRVDTPRHRPTLNLFRGELQEGAEKPRPALPSRRGQRRVATAKNPLNLIRVMPAKGQECLPSRRTDRRYLSSTRDIFVAAERHASRRRKPRMLPAESSSPGWSARSSSRIAPAPAQRRRFYAGAIVEAALSPTLIYLSGLPRLLAGLAILNG